MALADHNITTFGADCYNADGSLSGKGHYEMGKQLGLAVGGTSDRFPDLYNLTTAPAPAAYSDVAPAVVSADNSITITGLDDTAWTVEIGLESYMLTVNAEGTEITVDNLPAGEAYTLTITAADLSLRLPVMAGTVGGGEAAEYAPELTDAQQAIVDLANSEESVTWMFMGDSITHGWVHTHGYDSVSQIFEKFVKDDLGRTDDIVINTAVSSADTIDTLQELESRLTRYQADVVSIMLGTNDCAQNANHTPMGIEVYKTNLRTLINTAKEMGAIVILRTPVATKSPDSARTQMDNYVEAMREVSREYDDVILVEQYSNMYEAFNAAPYMKQLLFNSSDILHPTTEGQTWMMHRFLEATGLMKDGYIANLSYASTVCVPNRMDPPVTFENGTATLNTTELATASGLSLYLVKFLATDADGRVYSTEGKMGDNLTLSNLPENVTFFAEATPASSGTWVRFGVEKKDVALTVGETVTFEDDTGYYVNADTTELDANVATVQITGTVTETAMAATEAVTTIEDGDYIIVSTRANKPVTNGTASADGGNGLKLNGTKDQVSADGIWTIKAVNGGYTIQDADGKYMTIGSQSAAMTTTETVVSIARNGSNWTISKDGAYLNDFGGKATCAAGWKNNAAPNDAGSQWLIYKAEEVPVDGTSVITFTGVGIGQTQVLIGDIMYRITVSEEAPRVNPFEDVPEDSFYIDPVLWAVEKGITQGIAADKFGPFGVTNRAQAVPFLWRYLGQPESDTVATFTDVEAGAWYAAPINWAVEKNVTQGIGNNLFGIEGNCNRAQAVTFLFRATAE